MDVTVFCCMILFVFVTIDVVIPVTQAAYPEVITTIPEGFLACVTVPHPRCASSSTGVSGKGSEKLSPTTDQVTPQKARPKKTNKIKPQLLSRGRLASKS